MGKISNESVTVVLILSIGAAASFYYQLDRLAYLCMFFCMLVVTFDGVSALFAIHKLTLKTNELLEEINTQLRLK